jgi:hypothetical protein
MYILLIVLESYATVVIHSTIFTVIYAACFIEIIAYVYSVRLGMYSQNFVSVIFCNFLKHDFIE